MNRFYQRSGEGPVDFVAQVFDMYVDAICPELFDAVPGVAR
jgi:hypothetical protein